MQTPCNIVPAEQLKLTAKDLDEEITRLVSFACGGKCAVRTN